MEWAIAFGVLYLVGWTCFVLINRSLDMGDDLPLLIVVGIFWPISLPATVPLVRYRTNLMRQYRDEWYVNERDKHEETRDRLAASQDELAKEKEENEALVGERASILKQNADAQVKFAKVDDQLNRISDILNEGDE